MADGISLSAQATAQAPEWAGDAGKHPVPIFKFDGEAPCSILQQQPSAPAAISIHQLGKVELVETHWISLTDIKSTKIHCARHRNDFNTALK